VAVLLCDERGVVALAREQIVRAALARAERQLREALRVACALDAERPELELDTLHGLAGAELGRKRDEAVVIDVRIDGELGRLHPRGKTGRIVLLCPWIRLDDREHVTEAGFVERGREIDLRLDELVRRDLRLDELVEHLAARRRRRVVLVPE